MFNVKDRLGGRREEGGVMLSFYCDGPSRPQSRDAIMLY